jgi:hypothetical protein
MKKRSFPIAIPLIIAAAATSVFIFLEHLGYLPGGKIWSDESYSSGDSLVLNTRDYSLTMPAPYVFDIGAEDSVIRPKESGAFSQITLSGRGSDANPTILSMLSEEKAMIANKCKETDVCGTLIATSQMKIGETDALIFTVRYPGRSVDDKKGYTNEYYFLIPRVRVEDDPWLFSEGKKNMNTYIDRFWISEPDTNSPTAHAKQFYAIMQDMQLK